MKFIFSFLVVTVIASSFSFAQNTFPATGNVGIGVGTPTVPLEIQRPIITGQTVSLQQWEWSDSPQNWSLRLDMYHTGSAIDYRFVQKSAATDHNVLAFSSGNVGIGLTNPDSKLQVGGSLSAVNLSQTLGASTPVIYGSIGGGQYSGWGVSLNHVVENANSNTYGMGLFTTDSYNTGRTEKVRITGNGNVGIGTISPAAKLDIPSAYNSSTNTNLKMFYQGTWQTPEYANNFRFIDIASTEGNKILQLNGYGMGIGYNPPVINSSDKLYVDGNVGIGTTDPKGYKLAVNGSVVASSITVKTYGTWPDYVFEPKYKLGSLQEIKAYINKNKHLPEMPSAAEIETTGLNLGEMNLLLTKKIEELTLYLIEKDTEVNELKSQIKSLENIGKSQQDQLDTIKHLLEQVVKKRN